MKRLISLVLCVVMVFSSLGGVVFADNEITVMLNGNLLEFDVSPQIIDNRVMVPMRAIFEALGATVEWNEPIETIIATIDGINITMRINWHEIIVWSEPVVRINLDVAPQIIDNRTLVPIRAVSEALNSNVVWIAETSRVVINSRPTDVGNQETTISPQPIISEHVQLLMDIYDILLDNNTELQRIIRNSNQSNIGSSRDTFEIITEEEHQAIDHLIQRYNYRRTPQNRYGLVWEIIATVRILHIAATPMMSVASLSAVLGNTSDFHSTILDVGRSLSDASRQIHNLRETIERLGRFQRTSLPTIEAPVVVEPNLPVTPTTTMYSQFPTVPDFGAFANVSLNRSTPLDSGISFSYNLVNIEAGAIDGYIDLLGQHSFAPIGTFDGPDGPVLAYRSGNISVMIGIMQSDLVIMISRN